MALQKQHPTNHFIRSIEAKELKKRSFAIRFADELTSFFGSFSFLVLNVVFFASWLLINSGALKPVLMPFDTFPFPMLTTVVSLEAIFLTLIVLMSQNRQSLISSLREEIDIQVNLIAEREITKILQLLHAYFKVRGIKIEDAELENMLKEVDASYLERTLEKELTDKKNAVNKSPVKPIVGLEEEFEKFTKPIKKAIDKI